ncbi:MAG: L-ribulose-5-phosphate 4-epimerase AraD [Solirubrobacterales bacterium]|nr:L-ribulose-5-phosphate 4-epimerase AraD [Solirubrobacterales bacterium]
MLEELRDAVLAANRALPAHGLVKLTSGNVSGLDRDAGIMAIKASGVAYATMTADDMILVDLEREQVVAGERRPSTDTPTHAALYREFGETIGGIVHTHSTYATAWAQAGRPIPLLGTTHADFCAEPVPVTRALTPEEIDAGYEANTGRVLIEAAGGHPDRVPAVLARGHAPFCWAADADRAVQAAVTLEEVAELALYATLLAPGIAPLDPAVRDKHFERKWGPDAYYGQG